MSDSDDTTDLVATFLLRYENPRTRRAYRMDLRRFFDAEPVDARSARSVDRSRVREHLRGLEDSGRSGSTLRRRLSALRSFFDWLFEIELLDANPAGPVEAPRSRGDVGRRRDARGGVRGVPSSPGASSRVFTLTREQVRRLLTATSEAGEAEVRDRALILTLVHGMLRRSEAARMDVRHLSVHSDHAVLDLTGVVDRPIPQIRLPAKVAGVLERAQSRYGIAGGALWRSLSRNHTRGDRLSPDGIYRMVRRTAGRAGLERAIGARLLRQTGCVLALEAGATMESVADQAGHRSLQTTRRYVTGSGDRVAGAGDRIEL